MFPGAPQARAQELSDAVTSAVFHHVSMMMFEQHYNLLALLVSLERLRISRKASNKELSLFVNGFEKHGLDEGAMLDQKPAWMDKNVSICVTCMDKNMSICVTCMDKNVSICVACMDKNVSVCVA